MAEHCERWPVEKTILDLGADTVTLRLLEQGASVTAVDRSGAMLERLQEKCPSHEKRLRVLERDGADLSPLASASFDAVNIYAFRAALEEGWKAEDTRDELRNLRATKLQTRPAYGSHCLPLWATKPE